MDLFNEEQKLALLGMAALCTVTIVHLFHIHREEAMKRKFYCLHREILKKVTESELYKKATPSDKMKILDEFERAVKLYG